MAAINRHDYAKAWSITGHSGTPDPRFVSGYSGTVKDTLTIISVSGNVVTAQLSALQTDGTVRIYQGTYIIKNDVMIPHVRRIR